ncbi:uncharacterized protein K460DRAFT_185258 [Cucurbitaria berberidis CBS 394.84]|uniref:Uncharacterized protein n=1 Tax=Cucurbitaria berberidis CBS 394.84 TaxID=1168544 RepID=A0A9P4GAY6_9PLEO|nr:uncharacterized protein K460DRAFT_185258 [Cucurbitaria berberidis CBS 394.84]KAF1842443.1 hypothetical protein K460DRAFT_185258 [Cucurbitaria berberidis CBS 394.84]
MPERKITDFFLPRSAAVSNERGEKRAVNDTPNTLGFKRPKQSHNAAQDLPIKDPLKHTTAQVRGRRGTPFFHEGSHESNKGFLEQEQKGEREVDAWVQEVIPRLQSGEKIPIGDVFAHEFMLSCPEFFTQYIGWDRDWSAAQPYTRIGFPKNREPIENPFPELLTAPHQMSADIMLHADIHPGACTTLPFTRRKFASLDPVLIKLFHWENRTPKQGLWKLWFLGNGFLRLEIDTQPYTGKPGKLMISGIQEKGISDTKRATDSKEASSEESEPKES